MISICWERMVNLLTDDLLRWIELNRFADFYRKNENAFQFFLYEFSFISSFVSIWENQAMKTSKITKKTEQNSI